MNINFLYWILGCHRAIMNNTYILNSTPPIYLLGVVLSELSIEATIHLFIEIGHAVA
jgi:hypothetical protein